MFTQNFEYHQNTKHSYFSVRNNPNRLDWNNQPSAFKNYPKNFKSFDLDLENKNHQFLYYIAGLSAKKVYPNVEYYLRINPSAGALYPNEVYFQSRNIKGIKDGIYHLNISQSSITLLQELKDDGIEPFFGKNEIDGFIFLISSLYYRSSWKYKNRAFRYCLLDAGHIIGSLEASSFLYEKSFDLVYDFKKSELNKEFAFKNEEFFTSSIVVGVENQRKIKQIKLNIPNVDGTYFFEENSMIEKAYKDSLEIKDKKEQKNRANFFYNKEVFKDIVFKRRSIRDFSKQAIKKEEFLKILEVLNEPIKSDVDEDIKIYCVINRVVGMPLGLYLKDRYIKEGDFKNQAGYLCLEQALGKDSAVTFFLTSESKNYQAMYQKAGIIGHRLYLISNYLGYGCSGIGAYYDDEVCEFVGEYTQVLYALAIGN